MILLLQTALAICLLIHTFYWLYFFGRMAVWQPPEMDGPADNPSLSVIVCARNEAQNLPACLQSLLAQDYPSFELIVVNDDSTDRTAAILEDWSRRDSRLIPLHRTEGGSKKKALLAGISRARGELLLLTDADCRPASPLWITSMVQAAQNQKAEVVLGYSPFHNRAGLLNAFIRFENLLIAIQYGGFCLAGFPYMGVGRNLLYRRLWFESSRGFEGHMDLASGDDDLLLAHNARSTGTAIQFAREAWVYSEAKSSLRAYFQQRARHLSTASHYPLIYKFLLLLRELVFVGCYLLFLVLWVAGYPLTALAGWAFYLLVSWPFFYFLSIRLGQPGLRYLFPILDIWHFILKITLSPYIVFKRHDW